MFAQAFGGVVAVNANQPREFFTIAVPECLEHHAMLAIGLLLWHAGELHVLAHVRLGLETQVVDQFQVPPGT